MILSAAIQTKHYIHSVHPPARHADIIQKVRGFDLDAPSGERGFIDDKGQFLGRAHAAIHAVECGQVKQDAINWNLGLFTEDLW